MRFDVLFGVERWRGSCFFFNDTATTEIYTLSLHDALPIQRLRRRPPHPWHLSSMDRLPPPALQQRHRERARAAVLGGALVQLTRTDPGMRVLDQAAEAAGGIVPVGAFTAGSGGSILTRLRMRDGSEAMLRVGA